MKNFEEYNLDCMTRDELMEFYQELNGKVPYTAARILFPSEPKNYTKTAVLLRCYAVNKALAMGLREDGINISIALEYEAICDRIYKDLPEYAKW